MRKLVSIFGLISILTLASLVWFGCSNDNGITTSADNSLGDQLEIVTPDAPQPLSGRPEYVPREILVKFAKDADPTVRSTALSKVGGAVTEQIITATMQFMGDAGLSIVRTDQDPKVAAAAMMTQPGVLYAEPNYYYYGDATSNDTYYTNGSLWGMYGDATSPANQYGSQAGEAWAAGNTGSSSVIVGVIDEGVMHTHIELTPNIWINPFDAADGIDNDGNGYIDDIRGWDFDKNDNSTYDGTADDHGSHVSGTIGAVGGNALGVAGVNWNVKIITCKFLGRAGGTTANAIKAVDYITDLKTRHGLNIPATNNSWGGGGFSQGLQDAIERANTANILFCAAAGNAGTNNDATANYPSNYPNANIIAVAALTSTGALASYSNYGATKVDIGAPGSGIWSTVPTKSGASGVASYNGTSMATPHVTGGAALYAASHPGASAATIKAAILGSAVATSSLSGKCVTGGRLNVSGF